MAKLNRKKEIIKRINKLKTKYKEMGVAAVSTYMFSESKCFHMSRYDDLWYMEWFKEWLTTPFEKPDIPNIMKSCNYVWRKLNEKGKKRF